MSVIFISSVDGHLDCFLLITIMNYTSEVDVGCIPGSGIAYPGYLYNSASVDVAKWFSEVVVLIYLQQCRNSYCSTSSLEMFV